MASEMDVYNAVILGAGVGGMCAASLLANKGLSVAVIERRPILGGRFSTIHRQGYQRVVGGLAVPVGRDLEPYLEHIQGIKHLSRVCTTPAMPPVQVVMPDHQELPGQPGLSVMIL